MHIEQQGLYPFSPARAQCVIVPKPPVAQLAQASVLLSASYRSGGESNVLSEFPLECSVPSGCFSSRDSGM